MGIDSDFVLSSTSPQASLSVFYLYVTSPQLSCDHCSFKNIYENSCVDQCPTSTYSADFRGSKFCKGCSDKLNYEVQG